MINSWLLFCDGEAGTKQLPQPCRVTVASHMVKPGSQLHIRQLFYWFRITWASRSVSFRGPSHQLSFHVDAALISHARCLLVDRSLGDYNFMSCLSKIYLKTKALLRRQLLGCPCSRVLLLLKLAKLTLYCLSKDPALVTLFLPEDTTLKI